MPKINNTNVTMTDEVYRNSYKRALEKNRKNATSRPRNIDYPSSRTRHYVEGNVAPIESAPIGRNIYQNGNMSNIARNVADNERHDDVGRIIEAKNWKDRVKRVSKNGYYDPTAHAINSHYWNGLLYPTDMRNADTGYYGPEVHATTGRERKKRP